MSLTLSNNTVKKYTLLSSISKHAIRITTIDFKGILTYATTRTFRVIKVPLLRTITSITMS